MYLVVEWVERDKRLGLGTWVRRDERFGSGIEKACG